MSRKLSYSQQSKLNPITDKRAADQGYEYGLLICWVAREVYGEQDPRWMMFRYWLLGRGSDRLLRRYMARGPQIAKWLSTRPKYKRRVRRWMNRCIAQLPDYARNECVRQTYALAA